MYELDPRVNFIISRRDPDGTVTELVRTHNVLVNHGRDFVIRQISSLGSATYVKWIGIGIGGDGSGTTPNPGAVNPAFDTDYPGTNLQSSTNPTVARLERPAKITSTTWLAQVTETFGSAPYTYVEFTYTLGATEVNQVGSTYATVPFSEAGLFLSDESDTLDPYSGTAQQPFAYVTFAPQSKVNGSALDLKWVLRV